MRWVPLALFLSRCDACWPELATSTDSSVPDSGDAGDGIVEDDVAFHSFDHEFPGSAAVDPDDLDTDGDGYTPRQGDCDDADPSANPEAEDVAGDGVDSDCDGASDAPSSAVGSASAPSSILLGDEAGDNAGRGLALAPDLDDDGIGEVVLGAPYSGAVGVAWLLSGARLLTAGGRLSGASLAELAGSNSSAAGGAVVSPGDVNGDGRADLLIGARGTRTSTGKSSAGAAHLVSGDASGRMVLSDAWVSILGEEQLEQVGAAVSGGLLDGDDYADVVIGAPEWETTAGAVGVLFGSESLDLAGSHSFADLDAQIYGASLSDRLGSSLAVLPAAVDSDAALLIGSPERSPGDGFTVSQAGSAWLVSGELPSKLQLGDEDTGRARVLELTGAVESGYAGDAVASGGDLFGLGASAAVVVGRSEQIGTVVSGQIYALSPATLADTGWSGVFSLDDADCHLLWTARTAGERATAASGDLDGDGYSDLIIGITADDSGGIDAGAVFLALGGATLPDTYLLADAAIKIYGEDPGDQFGGSIAGGVDLDGGGAADLLVGAPGYGDSATPTRGALYILSGEELF